MKKIVILASLALSTQSFGSSDLLTTDVETTPVSITIQTTAGASIENIAQETHLNKVIPRRIEGFYVAQTAGDVKRTIEELMQRKDIISAYIDTNIRLVRAH